MILPLNDQQRSEHTSTIVVQGLSKAYGSNVRHGYFRPVNQHWDACAPLRHLCLVQANPPGAELVTCSRTVQVSWRKVMEPKVPQRPQHC